MCGQAEEKAQLLSVWRILIIQVRSWQVQVFSTHFFIKRLTLQPVFDEKCLEAELDYRGRVRVSYLLWLFWGIYHHKHTWKMLRGLLGRDNSSDE